MSNNDFQNAQIQTTLLELARSQGSMSKAIESLALDLQKGRERAIAENQELKKQIADIKKYVEDMNNDVDVIVERAKFWKWGLCLILGAGGIVLSLVEFGNEIIQLIKALGNHR